MSLQQDTTKLTDPRTGLVRQEIPVSGARLVVGAVARARRAQPAWAALTPARRSRLLLRLAESIEDHADAFVAAERAGTGKPEAEARGEVEQSADVLRFFAGALRTGNSPAAGHLLPGRESWVRWEPLGVVAAIVPWNYPLLMTAWRAAPALAAGNTVVVKPAETTPDSAVILGQYCDEILGPGVVTVVPGDRETGRLLVDTRVDAVAFTGSAAGGLDVVRRAGLRRVSLELGGNGPAVVLPDADEDTYEALVRACTYNAGQSCASPARVITLRENYTEVVEGLAKAMAVRSAGTDFGPLNNPDQVARYDRILASSAAGIRHVADITTQSDETRGYWRPGQILADLPSQDPAVHEEIFGPVLTVQAAAGHDEAVRMANGVPQALGASVWSTSMDTALALAGSLDAGEVWVNCHLEQTPELPHGGRRGSGHGTDLSVLALSDYQRPKTVTVRALGPER
ncbi:aldehyde dehydrogenase family protein [Streptomyces sp. NPDC057950]|uniref:aldehyde dehydrogenase family protein n=1 Tax=Streptomyces sp. NPDC057950 TaxID=3346288 RepID=UPI0036EDE11A